MRGEDRGARKGEMSANSKIEWTDATWNPTRGCSRVSEGCRNCYAERIAARLNGTDIVEGKRVLRPFAGFAVRTPSGPRWTGRVELIPEALNLPLHWRKPRRVFVNSMSDLFHEKLPDEAIDRVFAVMALCPQHTFQALTKRAGRMRNYFMGLASAASEGFVESPYPRIAHCIRDVPDRFKSVQRGNLVLPAWPLPNVWLGVSCEDQVTADERIPLLLQTPAAVRFVSLEPLLGPITLTELQPAREVEVDSLNGKHGIHRPLQGRNQTLNWVIVGGESGPQARPMHPDWARTIRDQCIAAGVPFFFKQWGGCDKKASGRLLDGREWNEFPK